jgi:hypothetical protein
VRVTPRVEVADAEDVVAGRAVTLRYTWTAAADSVADRPYGVFVHFIDERGAVAFTDDHAPPAGGALGKPGEPLRYERRVVLPDEPGKLRVRVGLTSTAFPYKARVTDVATGAATFPVAAVLRVRDNPTLAEESVAGAAGFDPWERDPHASMHWHRWTHRESRFLFLQPADGGRLQLQAYVPRRRLTKDPRVTMRVADRQASVSRSSDDRFLLELEIPGDGVDHLAEGTLLSDDALVDREREIAVCVERFRIVPATSGNPPP